MTLPVKPQRPLHDKQTRRLRGIHRAKPHLGEDQGISWVVWGIGGVLVLGMVGGFFLWRANSPAPVTPTLPALASPTPKAPTSAPTPSTTATTTPSPTAAVLRYRVQPGDTLSAIAQKYRVSVEQLMNANNLRNETIRAGDELLIPLTTPRP